jgi:hypothetical protein
MSSDRQSVSEISESDWLRLPVAATVSLRSSAFVAKAVERSDSCDGPKGAVATARHHHGPHFSGEQREGDSVLDRV